MASYFVWMATMRGVATPVVLETRRDATLTHDEKKRALTVPIELDESQQEESLATLAAIFGPPPKIAISD